MRRAICCCSQRASPAPTATRVLVSGAHFQDPWVQPCLTLTSGCLWANPQPQQCMSGVRVTPPGSASPRPGLDLPQLGRGRPGTLSLPHWIHFEALSCQAPPCPGVGFRQTSAAPSLLARQALPPRGRMPSTHTQGLLICHQGRLPRWEILPLPGGLHVYWRPRTLGSGTLGPAEFTSYAGRKQGAGQLPKWQRGLGRQPACGGHPLLTGARLAVWGRVPNWGHLVGPQTGAARMTCGWWTRTTTATRCSTPRAPKASARTSTWPLSTVCALPHPRDSQRGVGGVGSRAEISPASPSCPRP